MNSHLVERETSTILSSLPHFLDHGTVMKLISNLESACICRGYPRKEFVDMVNSRGGVIGGVNGFTASSGYEWRDLSVHYTDHEVHTFVKFTIV